LDMVTLTAMITMAMVATPAALVNQVGRDRLRPTIMSDAKRLRMLGPDLRVGHGSFRPEANRPNRIQAIVKPVGVDRGHDWLGLQISPDRGVRMPLRRRAPPRDGKAPGRARRRPSHHRARPAARGEETIKTVSGRKSLVVQAAITCLGSGTAAP
jgi:hypothetical protein